MIDYLVASHYNRESLHRVEGEELLQALHQEDGEELVQQQGGIDLLSHGQVGGQTKEVSHL